MEELTLRQVSERTGLSTSLIRTYIKQFHLQTARTDGGHRRFSEENVESLLVIKGRIQNEGWSYLQVRASLGIDEPTLESTVKLEENVKEIVEVEGEEDRMGDDETALLPRFEAFEEKLIRLSGQLDEMAQFLQVQNQVAAADATGRLQHITDFITTEHVKARLRVDALKAWAEMPELKRTLRAGLFRRQEDITKREFFIAAYIREKLENELMHEFGIQ